jgi:IS4 transposase
LLCGRRRWRIKSIEKRSNQARKRISRGRVLPSLIRFLIYVAVLAGLVYAGLYALANYVRVTPREITQTITLPKAGK